MEKSNELNKFLSYIHMGTTIYRIYYSEAKKFNDEKLINLIVEIEEIFKTHEEKITKQINEMNEEATDSLTAAGIFGVYKERMKVFDSSFSICINAIKSTNMGLLSALKFLKENSKLDSHIKEYVVNVISDYKNIQSKLINYTLSELN